MNEIPTAPWLMLHKGVLVVGAASGVDLIYETKCFDDDRQDGSQAFASASWSAPAECNGDGAFERAVGFSHSKRFGRTKAVFPTGRDSATALQNLAKQQRALN